MTHRVSNKYYLRIVQIDGDREVGIGNIKRAANLDHLDHLCFEDFSTVKSRAAEERKKGVLTSAPYRVELRLDACPMPITVDQDHIRV